MIKHLRDDNCIKFLGFKEKERVLFCKDTLEGVQFFSDPQSWQGHGACADEKADSLTENEAEFTLGSFEDVIYYMDHILRGDRRALADKISRVFQCAAPGGRLVLLLENPYAMHLLAGETDAHGNLFPAMQRRPADERLISCNMLKDVLTNDLSLPNIEWYYPYPTLDFPVCIYSDAYLPKTGECDENLYNFDHARLELFPETDAFDAAVRSGMFREFANCYLIVAGAPLRDEIYYTRYSNERAEGLRIRTDILKEGVRKAAFDPASEAHIETLAKWEERLETQLAPLEWEGRRIHANRIVRKESGSVTFAYVEGVSLEQRLDELLAAGKADEAKRMLLTFAGLLRRQPGLKPFAPTQDFIALFGENVSERLMQLAGGEAELPAAPVTDIDMICRNILIGRKPDGDVTVIDYEWTFGFPIPVDYVIYRVLFFYLEFGDRRRSFGDFDFYEALSVTGELREIFSQMESRFQRYVQGGVTLIADAYRQEGMPVLSAKELKKQLLSLETASIRIRTKRDGGWQEERRVLKRDADGIASFTVDFAPGEVTEIELLPDVSGALVRVCLLQEDQEGSKELAFAANGISVAPILYLFDEPAEIRIGDILAGTHRVYVSLEVVALPDTFVVESKRSLCDLRETLANRDKQLDDLYHSTSWKLTRPLRRLKGND